MKFGKLTQLNSTIIIKIQNISITLKTSLESLCSQSSPKTPSIRQPLIYLSKCTFAVSNYVWCQVKVESFFVLFFFFLIILSEFQFFQHHLLKRLWFLIELLRHLIEKHLIEKSLYEQVYSLLCTNELYMYLCANTTLS